MYLYGRRGIGCQAIFLDNLEHHWTGLAVEEAGFARADAEFAGGPVDVAAAEVAVGDEFAVGPGDAAEEPAAELFVALEINGEDAGGGGFNCGARVSCTGRALGGGGGSLNAHEFEGFSLQAFGVFEGDVEAFGDLP